jgi:hypothetical protein
MYATLHAAGVIVATIEKAHVLDDLQLSDHHHACQL